MSDENKWVKSDLQIKSDEAYKQRRIDKKSKATGDWLKKDPEVAAALENIEKNGPWAFGKIDNELEDLKQENEELKEKLLKYEQSRKKVN